VLVTADGTKLLPFIIFKGQHEKAKQTLTGQGILACSQPNDSFDETVYQKWTNTILAPHVQGNDYALLLPL
jgi:hypothetical protein